MLDRRKGDMTEGGSDTDECHRTAHPLGSTETLRGIYVRSVYAAYTIESVDTHEQSCSGTQRVHRQRTAMIPSAKRARCVTRTPASYCSPYAMLRRMDLER